MPEPNMLQRIGIGLSPEYAQSYYMGRETEDRERQMSQQNAERKMKLLRGLSGLATTPEAKAALDAEMRSAYQSAYGGQLPAGEIDWGALGQEQEKLTYENLGDRTVGLNARGEVVTSYPRGAAPDSSVQVNIPGLEMLTKETTNKVQAAQVGEQDAFAALEHALDAMDPKFLTIPGQAFAEGINYLQRWGFKVGSDNEAYLDNFDNFKTKTMGAFNDTLRQKSGAVVTQWEEPRFRQEQPNMDDGPTRYVSKLKAKMQMLRAADLRHLDMVQKGLIREEQRLDSLTEAEQKSLIARFPLDRYITTRPAGKPHPAQSTPGEWREVAPGVRIGPSQ